MQSKTKLSTRPSPQIPMEPIIEEQVEVEAPQQQAVQRQVPQQQTAQRQTMQQQTAQQQIAQRQTMQQQTAQRQTVQQQTMQQRTAQRQVAQQQTVQPLPGFDDEFEDVEDLKEEIETPKVRPTPVSTASRVEEIEEQPVKRGRGRPPRAVQTEGELEQKPKRGRGRPPKNPRPESEVEKKPKRGRGRPPKNPPIEEDTLLPGLDDIDKDEQYENYTIPGFDDLDNDQANENDTLQGFDDIDNNQEYGNDTLPGLDDIDNNQEYGNDTLPGLDDIDNNQEYGDNTLPGFDDVDNNQEYGNDTLPGFDDIDNNQEYGNDTLPGFDDVDNNQEYGNDTLPGFDDIDNNQEYGSDVLPGFENVNNQNVENTNLVNGMNQDNRLNTSRMNVASNSPKMSSFDDKEVETIDLSYLLKSDKKIVTFVGTSKNGTSFIVNNLADFLSTSGVNVAILDTTRNKNSYYIYTNNEEELRNIAVKSISDLAHGTANGITVNKNLTVYTSLPGEDDEIVHVDKILETLLQNHTLILIDTDFETPSRYFEQSHETYLAQTWDILTIQPLTAFLRNLKARGILDQNKLRIILNKTVKIKGISEKTIIGGMAYYNDPAMSYMTELFDRTMIRYITIPFEEETYAKYLEGVIECNITVKGYSKLFMQKFRELSNMVFPMSNTYAPPSMNARAGQNAFTPNMNNTLNQMRNNY